MAYSWRIEKAAVEQLISFPSKICFNAYFAEMARKGEPCELLQTDDQPDGTVTALVRKRYNQNEFLRAADREAILTTNHFEPNEVIPDANIQN